MANFKDPYSSSEQDALSYYGGMREDTNKMLADMLASRHKAYALAAKKQREGIEKEKYEQDTDWLSTAGHGASLGGQFGGGGYGALIGGILGTAIGQGKAANTRHDKGQGWGEAIWRTLVDTEPLTSGRAVPALAAGLGSAASGIQARKAATAAGVNQSEVAAELNARDELGEFGTPGADFDEGLMSPEEYKKKEYLKTRPMDAGTGYDWSKFGKIT